MDGIFRKEKIINMRKFCFRREQLQVTNLISFYSSDRNNSREGWMGRLHIFGPKKAFDEVPYKRL